MDRATHPTAKPIFRRPPFAGSFPRTASIDALVDAFVEGDYAQVRDGAKALARSATQDEIRQAARTLIARTEPDPLALWLLALAAALLTALSAYWIKEGKPPPSSDVQSDPTEPLR